MGSEQASSLTREEWVGGTSHRQWESRSLTHGRWVGGVLYSERVGRLGPEEQAMADKAFIYSSEQVVEVGGRGPLVCVQWEDRAPHLWIIAR